MGDITPAAEAEGASRQVSMTLAEFRRVVMRQHEEAAATKEEGNLRFKAGEVEAAEDKYHAAADMADAVLKDFVDMRKKMEGVRVSALNNLAACSLKERRYEDTIGFCEDVLRANSRDVKAMYRLGQALLGVSRLEEAVQKLTEALRLDPANQDVEKLLRRARAEVKASDERAKKRFGGMFEKSEYKGMRDEAAEQEAAARRQQRAALAGPLRPHAAHDEAALLERWVSSGIQALEAEERKTLELFLRRLAAAGQLDASDVREGLQAHGLEGAFRIAKEELPEDELARYQEQQKLAEVKRITIKAQQRHTLTTEEYQVIKEYKQEEIERLREKHRLEGLSQEERYLLEKMKESVEKESQFYEQMEATGSAAEGYLNKLNSGAHMGPKERFKMYKLMAEEEARLEAKDDAVGLSTQELRQLKQLKAERMQRLEQQKSRKAQADYVQLMSEL